MGDTVRGDSLLGRLKRALAGTASRRWALAAVAAAPMLAAPASRATKGRPRRKPTIVQAALLHETTTGNIVGNSTAIDHPATNGRPNLLLLVTHNFNPPGAAGADHQPVVGVFYRLPEAKWCIFNEDGAEAMLPGRFFNVLVALPRR